MLNHDILLNKLDINMVIVMLHYQRKKVIFINDLHICLLME